MTLKPIHRAMPITDHAYGEVVERNSPKLKVSPLPVNNRSKDKLVLRKKNRIKRNHQNQTNS